MQFNTNQANTSQFNYTSVVTIQTLVDSVASSDVKPMTDQIVKADTITSTDVTTKTNTKPMGDFVFMADVATKQITRKLIQDSVKTNDWLEPKRSITANPWTSQ